MMAAKVGTARGRARLHALAQKLCKKWKMNCEDMERAASVYALMYRDEAPEEARLLFTGRPSYFGDDAKNLSLAFFLAYVEASDRLGALDNEPVEQRIDAAACWRIALRISGVRL